jgi:hypothetical protein
VVAIFPF